MVVVKRACIVSTDYKFNICMSLDLRYRSKQLTAKKVKSYLTQLKEDVKETIVSFVGMFFSPTNANYAFAI